MSMIAERTTEQLRQQEYYLRAVLNVGHPGIYGDKEHRELLLKIQAELDRRKDQEEKGGKRR